MNHPILSQPPADAHIGACGLFCTNCDVFRRSRCPGCQIAPGFARCAVRQCCAERGICTCAECEQFRAGRDFRECKKISSGVAKVFSSVFGSDRPAALTILRDNGCEAYLAAKRRTGRP